MKGKFDWRAAYFNLVSLVGVITILIAAIAGGHGALRFVVPELAMDQHEWRQVESFEAFERGRGGDRVPRRVKLERLDNSAEAKPEISEEKLRALWQDHRRLVVQGEKRRGLWDILQSLVTLAVAVPLFWWHRRGAKRLKTENEE